MAPEVGTLKCLEELRKFKSLEIPLNAGETRNAGENAGETRNAGVLIDGRPDPSDELSNTNVIEQTDTLLCNVNGSAS
jgi:hypothetical protein